jgi:hypothetical protein
MNLFKSLNLYAMLALVVLGGTIVTGIFMAGARHNELRHEAAAAEVNAPIIEQRGKDEAELAAEKAAAERADAAVAGAISQVCPVTEATANLLASVK